MGSFRRRGLIPLVAAVAALALPAAASAYDDWNQGFPGFPSNAAESPRANCDNAADACIDRTVGEMWRRFHTTFDTCDHNAIFSLTYLRVTEAIRDAVRAGFYPDEAWLHYQDAIFARVYFLGYDNWAAGRTELVPESWQVTFDAGRDKSVEGIGNLLLSMNAHINRDFPFILYHAGLTNPDGSSKKPEHDSGNDLLRDLYKPMLTELASRFDETIDDYDVPGLFADDEGFFQILVQWRETTWQNAQRLADAADDAERRAVAAEIEDYANSQAQLILNGARYKPGDEAEQAAREVHCAENGGQRPGYKRGADLAKPDRGAKLKGRTLIVRLRCPDGIGPCHGDAKARVPRRRDRAGAGASVFEMAGRERFRLGVGKSQTLRLKLKKKAARKLSAHPKRGVWVAARSKQGPGDAVTKRVKARL